MYNPNSLKNLEKGTKFTPGDSRMKHGRTAGVRNMKTVLLDWLSVETDCTDPAGNEIQLPLVDKVALAIINKACEGNVSAVNFVSGHAFGKATEQVDTNKEEENSIDWSVYTDEELQLLANLMNKGVKDKQEMLDKKNG